MIVQNYPLVQIMQDGGVSEKPVIYFSPNLFGTILPQKLNTSLNEWVTVKPVFLEIPVHPPPHRRNQR